MTTPYGEHPCFDKVEQSQEFLYLHRATFNSNAVMLFGKTWTGECFRYCCVTYTEEAWAVNGVTLGVVDKCLAEAQIENADNHPQSISVIPAETPYVLFDQAITRKTFDRLMQKMKVRMILPTETMYYVSKNHIDMVGVRIRGTQDFWLMETHKISQCSTEMIEVFLHVPGGEQFKALTNS